MHLVFITKIMRRNRELIKKILLVIALLSPVFSLAILIPATIINVVLSLMHFAVSLFPIYKHNQLKKISHKNKITVIVPSYNEPYQIVINTLSGLLKQTYTNFDVIVIDNNTQNKEVWRPVKNFCRNIDNFQFIHVDKLPGYKSGAINYALEYVSEDTDFILILDADYRLEPTAIETAMRYYADDKISFLQFPQAYVNVSHKNFGVALDFKNFFLTYMNMSNWMECVPSTGTISFIKYNVLKEIGGFNTECITEDAEIGFRLNQDGYKGIYVNETIGSGLMPFELSSLQKQRYRWGFGNIQIITKNLKNLIFSRNLSIKQKIGFWMHLTAWINISVINVALILIYTLKISIFGGSELDYLVLNINAANLIFFFGFKIVTYFLSLRRYNYNFKTIMKALISNLGLSSIHFNAFIDCLIDSRFYFYRTNKFIDSQKEDSFKVSNKDMLGIAVAISVILYALLTSSLLLALAGVIILMYVAASVNVERQMILTNQKSIRIIEKYNKNYLKLIR